MRKDVGPPDGFPVFGCLLMIGVITLVIYLMAVVIHFVGPIWLFVILLALLIAAMLTA